MASQEHPCTYDVVVVGSGAAGFAAAITARLRGLTALIVEKTDRYGGSTALSGGAIWVPGNFHLDAAALGDTREKARAYLDATVGDRVPGARKDAYLTHGPRMVEEFHQKTEVRFMYTPGYSDYYPERLGGMALGRSVEPRIVDLKRLGEARHTLRRAGLPTYGLTITSYDFRFLNMSGRTWAGRRKALRLAGRAAGALLRGRKLLSLGEALIARMRLSYDRLGGELWLRTPLTGLVTQDGKVTGIRVQRDGREQTIHARGGVVLASGGFSHDQRLREEVPARTDLGRLDPRLGGPDRRRAAARRGTGRRYRPARQGVGCAVALPARGEAVLPGRGPGHPRHGDRQRGGGAVRQRGRPVPRFRGPHVCL